MATEPTGKISIPRIGATRRATGQDEIPKTRNVTEMIVIGRVKSGEQAMEVSESTEVTEDNVVLQKTTVKVAECAGCGNLMKSDADVGGACYECRYLMCSECKKTHRCKSDGRLACPDHGNVNEDGEWMCDKCFVY
ncbi:MAG: hypothetical protein AAB288_12380 [Acidobacteriota bacterium]